MSDNDFQPTLWWVFDSESNSFSTLPAGPFLVPALILCGLLYIGKHLFDKKHSYESIAGEIAKTSYWRDQKKKYDHLIERRVATNNDLDFYDLMELRRLEKYLSNPRR